MPRPLCREYSRVEADARSSLIEYSQYVRPFNCLPLEIGAHASAKIGFARALVPTVNVRATRNARLIKTLCIGDESPKHHCSTRRLISFAN